jgi:hypothetical protein
LNRHGAKAAKGFFGLGFRRKQKLGAGGALAVSPLLEKWP